VTKEKLDHLINIYRTILVYAGICPQVVEVTRHLSREEMLGHCLWVLEDRIGPLLQRIGGFQEAVRLLGCIQETVMACGLCTIAETRHHANEARFTTWDRIIDNCASDAGLEEPKPEREL
jgi:hypothetical protein